MTFNTLSSLVSLELKRKLEKHEGLSVFAGQRAKFEGWLKVEVCEILIQYLEDVIPERGRIDITSKDWAIELKTMTTNYRYEGVSLKFRPITMNVAQVCQDIEKLQNSDYRYKAVLFIVFPLRRDKKIWAVHLKKIMRSLHELCTLEFSFSNGLPGIIYFGLVSD